MNMASKTSPLGAVGNSLQPDLDAAGARAPQDGQTLVKRNEDSADVSQKPEDTPLESRTCTIQPSATEVKEKLEGSSSVKKKPTETAQNVKADTEIYTTGMLPEATTAPPEQTYGNKPDQTLPFSREEHRKDVTPLMDEKKVDSTAARARAEAEAEARARAEAERQKQHNQSAVGSVGNLSINKNKNQKLPKRACLVHAKEQFPLDSHLLSKPEASKYFVKKQVQVTSGRLMAKLELHCSSEDAKQLPNLDATQARELDDDNTQEAADPHRERKHFSQNTTKPGYVAFSSDLGCFAGNIQYPLPTKKAVASRIGYGGNAIVFIVFHAGREFAVKKTIYRSKEISVHSQLCHPNIINLDAVLIGERHERHKEKHYVYCFMPKMDINFRNVLTTKEHGCLKHIKMQLVEKREQWEVVMTNVKHVLRGQLKALDYMHSQGLAHRDVKASNILIKMHCQCTGTEALYCNCPGRKFEVKIGDFDSSATVPGYQLQLEEHQMIRYASVLPLGTMGYRAPEVSMQYVMSGPYEVLYTTSVDIWSFGCLLLTIFIGKSGPLKQRGEAMLLLSVANAFKRGDELYQRAIKIKELQKCYANVPGVNDMVMKCLQVQPHCRPTAKELLQLDFMTQQ